MSVCFACPERQKGIRFCGKSRVNRFKGIPVAIGYSHQEYKSQLASPYFIRMRGWEAIDLPRHAEALFMQNRTAR